MPLNYFYDGSFMTRVRSLGRLHWQYSIKFFSAQWLFGVTRLVDEDSGNIAETSSGRPVAGIQIVFLLTTIPAVLPIRIKHLSSTPATNSGLTWNVERRADAVRVRLIGALDMQTVSSAESLFQALISEGVLRLGVDLSGVGFMDSTGLATLITLYKRLRESGGRLVLYSPGQEVSQLLGMTRLGRVLHVLDSQADADKALSETVAGAL